MSDIELRTLERIAQSEGTVEAWRNYWRLCIRHGRDLTPVIREMGRMLEVRQVMGPPRNATASQINQLLQHGGSIIRTANQTGYGGLGPDRMSDFARPEARRWLAQLAQRHSGARNQLAAFIRMARNNPNMANAARATVAAGGASASLRMLGGHMAQGLAVRTAMLRAGFAAVMEGAIAFTATPAGLVLLTAVAGLLILGAAWWYFSQPSEQETQVAAINCDCANIDAGLLNVGWIPHCREAEAALIAQAAEDGLQLQTENGVITGGTVCDSIAGPGAWPAAGAPEEPVSTAPRDDESCREFEGLTQRCVDR